MTEHPNVELTRRGYDAFAKGDLAALSELLADDVTWHVRGVGLSAATTTGGTRCSLFRQAGRGDGGHVPG